MSPPWLRTDLATRARYSQGAGIYRAIPEAVARPAGLAELRAALSEARRRGWSVTARGAGSAMPGDNVTSGLILDLAAFDAGRCRIDTASRRARTSPSVSLAAFNDRAAEHGLRFPVDPSSARWATLGGMVSTNAAGPRSVRSGSVRHWVRSLELETLDGPLELERGVTPDARHAVVARWQVDVEPLLRRYQGLIGDRFPRVRKNSAGYALDRYLQSGELLDVVVGSEGTLGVITGMSLDLETTPLHRASIRAAVGNRRTLPQVIEAIRAHDPATLEFLDRSFLRLIAGKGITVGSGGSAGLLLADFEGDSERDVIVRASAAAEAVRGCGEAVSIATGAEEIEVLWSIRHGASPILAGLADGRRSLQVIEDGCVPVARLADYLDAVDAAASGQRIDAVMFGHAGDGHVHVNLLPNLNDHDWMERVRSVYRTVSGAVIALGGTPSGEHGAGRLRAPILPQLYGPEVIDCFRAVKRAFDPEGLLNPGVIVDGGDDPLVGLKVGAGAARLPAGVEAYLMTIEQEARWEESRWVAPEK